MWESCAGRVKTKGGGERKTRGGGGVATLGKRQLEGGEEKDGNGKMVEKLEGREEVEGVYVNRGYGSGGRKKREGGGGGGDGGM